MKLGLLLIFYNNRPELERLVQSIPPNTIDFLVAIDGVFKYSYEQNDKLPELSNDGSKEVLLNSNLSVVFYDMPKSTEFAKRNKYLELCKILDIDCGIIIDSDEFFTYEPYLTPEEHWQRFKKHLEFEMQKYQHHNVFGINYVDEAGTKTYKPRIWVNPSEMRYIYGSHYHYANIKTERKDIELFQQNRICYLQQAQAIVKGITLKHDHSLRSPEYLKRREQYQKYLVSYESIIQQHKYSEEEADKLAKENPDKEFKPN